MCNTLMSGGFGNIPQAYSKGTDIGERMPAELPKSFEERMKIWKAKAQAEEWPGYYVKLAHISFGYDGIRYELLPSSLKVDDATFESVAYDILNDLEELGCDYGVYIGYMD